MLWQTMVGLGLVLIALLALRYNDQVARFVAQANRAAGTPTSSTADDEYRATRGSVIFLSVVAMIIGIAWVAISLTGSA